MLRNGIRVIAWTLVLATGHAQAARESDIRPVADDHAERIMGAGKGLPKVVAPRVQPLVVPPPIVENRFRNFADAFRAAVNDAAERSGDAFLSAEGSMSRRLITEQIARFQALTQNGPRKDTNPKLRSLFDETLAPGLAKKLREVLPKDRKDGPPKIGELFDLVTKNDQKSKAKQFFDSLDDTATFGVAALLLQETEAYKARELRPGSRPSFTAGMVKEATAVLDSLKKYSNEPLPLPPELQQSLIARLPGGRAEGVTGPLRLSEARRLVNVGNTLPPSELAALTGGLQVLHRMTPSGYASLADKAFDDVKFSARRSEMARAEVESIDQVVDPHAFDGIPPSRGVVDTVPSHSSDGVIFVPSDGWTVAPPGSDQAGACPLSGDGDQIAKTAQSLGKYAFPFEVNVPNQPPGLCNGSLVSSANGQVCQSRPDGGSNIALVTAQHCDHPNKSSITLSGFGRISADNIDANPVPGVPDSVEFRIIVPQSCASIQSTMGDRSLRVLAGAQPTLNDPTYLVLNKYRSAMNRFGRPVALAASLTPGARGSMNYRFDRCVPGQTSNDGDPGSQQGDSGGPFVRFIDGKPYLIGVLSTGLFHGNPENDLTLMATSGTTSLAGDRLAGNVASGNSFSPFLRQLALRRHVGDRAEPATHAKDEKK